MRLPTRIALISLTLVGIVAQSPLAAAPASADQSVTGEWTPPFDIGTVAIHATLMPNGKVLIFQRPSLAYGSDARVWDPTTGELADVSFQTARDIFCSDHSLLPDGRVLVTGGHQHHTSGLAGVKDTDIFDPAMNAWTAGPLLSEARWYPTNVEMADGTTLVFGGQSKAHVLSNTVDRYDPVSNTITQLPDTATMAVGLYPRMSLLPDGRLFWAGGSTTTPETYLFDPATSTWSDDGSFEYGGRPTENSILLPGLHQVLVIGGGKKQPTNTNEIFDFSALSPAWQYTAPMQYPRKNANAVLLADGTVLEVGGGNGVYKNPVLTPELFDPANQTWSSMADETGPRMYHSTALLLPDGRVLTAGQDKQNAYKTQGQVFSPPYLFKGDRPVIDSAPSAVVYNQAFSIQTSQAGDIARVALVHPGSVSHGNDSNQRYVDLAFADNGDGTVSLTAPVDGNTAPPGWYMLFAVNTEGVPSVASWVHVDTTLPGGEGPARASGVPSASSARVSKPIPSGSGIAALDRPEATGPKRASATLRLVCRR